ncbi:LOW QUALITY PROTEIN: hypothetical protein PanWU01x14_216710 [Parasponia andersonii]|uniref:Uncharacterized protein n=1 Tax=Parasponia andersonii TaxID=3476 RepID=A0A2P5BRJ7_PARAD|nr:LOW QUALITY PROTEIN: hypothetical protein PanWU01x14_216710 [Parasponia andersonii]
MKKHINLMVRALIAVFPLCYGARELSLLRNKAQKIEERDDERGDWDAKSGLGKKVEMKRERWVSR